MGKHTFDDLAFTVDAQGRLGLSDDDKEVIEESLFLTTTAEARGLPGEFDEPRSGEERRLCGWSQA